MSPSLRLPTTRLPPSFDSSRRGWWPPRRRRRTRRLAAARLRTVHGGGDGDALLPLALRLLRRLLLGRLRAASGETEALDGIGWSALADLIVELLAVRSEALMRTRPSVASDCCSRQPLVPRCSPPSSMLSSTTRCAAAPPSADSPPSSAARLAMRSVRGAAADDDAGCLTRCCSPPLPPAATPTPTTRPPPAVARRAARRRSLALELLALVASGPGSKVADALQAFVGGWLLPLPTGGGEDGRGGGRLASVLDGAGDEGGGGGGVAKEGEGEGGALSAVAACVSAVLSAGRADGAASGLGVRALEAAAALSAGPSAATQRYLGGRTRLAADCATILRDRSAPWGAAASRRMRAAAATALPR